MKSSCGKGFGACARRAGGWSKLTNFDFAAGPDIDEQLVPGEELHADEKIVIDHGSLYFFSVPHPLQYDFVLLEVDF